MKAISQQREWSEWISWSRLRMGIPFILLLVKVQTCWLWPLVWNITDMISFSLVFFSAQMMIISFSMRPPRLCGLLLDVSAHNHMSDICLWQYVITYCWHFDSHLIGFEKLSIKVKSFEATLSVVLEMCAGGRLGAGPSCLSFVSRKRL